ncbi:MULTISPECIES: methyl-accepting chemotaxis protein [unclassified Clostridium]|uniref:methyl-accepting chemotaxis protein n=1 Tax=unclassified Clostridium TaxID=2614128 RepID=UPI000297EB92|nr:MULTISPECIES: methyl-accepting chemotaxis protein [unclassified Clostridium]EKQ53624.1 MAG: methyl-accepting chemotaxis protein [Clostridium sp. Maddingley MBC34-26]
MNWLNNLKVGKKLTLLILCSLIGLLAVGITGYYFLSLSSKSIDSMYNERLLSSEWLNESRIHARAITADIYRIMITTDKNENDSLLKDIDTRAGEFNNYMNQYRKLNLDSFETNKLKEIDDNLSKYREERKIVLSLAAENKNQEAYEYYEKNVDTYAQSFLNGLIELGEHDRQIAEEINNADKSNFKAAIVTFSSIAIAASILIILLGVLITKRITKRLNDFVVFIGALAQGDFSLKINPENLKDKSEFGIVTNALDKMTKNIIELLKQLGSTSEQLVLASEELTASAEQSADASNLVATAVTTAANGADDQLSFANDTTRVVENIADKINTVYGNTNSVSTLTDNAKTSATSGEEAVEKAINQMIIIEKKTNETSAIISELEKKSVKIGQIVNVIEGISEQTNLLALNASIESARAGEAGKGFAVVASEIGKLAEQSQEATKEIAEIISEVQNKTNSAVSVMNENSREVDTGAKIVNIAGTSFRDILQMIREISEQIHAISKSINDINIGTKASVISVNNIQNISVKISDETQTISAAAEEQLASVEEIASSSKILSQMAEELRNIINRFKI